MLELISMKPSKLLSIFVVGALVFPLAAHSKEHTGGHSKKKHTSHGSTAVCRGGKATSPSASSRVGRGGGLGSQSESTILAKIARNNTSAVGLSNSKIEKALNYLYAHKSQFRNQKVMTLVKYNSPDIFHNVMYIIDLGSGEIEMHTVAQGSGGVKAAGNSHGSETGFMRIAEPYSGKHGLSARIDGLESGNRNTRSRAVVIHPANYVRDGCKAGRSWGCLALDPAVASKVIQKTKGGSLLYAFT